MPYIRYDWICLCIAVYSPLAYAGKENYQEPLQSYAAEMKRDAPDVQNSGFYGVIASSKAKRSLLNSLSDGSDPAETSGVSGNGNSIVNFASPTIYGKVRGNINIVVQRGAVQGSITSVKR